ncbi:MFS transporter [Paenibacillus silvae]|uniref:MFS transporter n=1 Tax=Paenibacillus silvae TaxID=1325358 RepID=UPI002004CE63|nr:MFS transporter [Paenibacillus silvae]MCK6077858.1 MFS transporter [Paenibacillus silvae]MCK6152057.1 MFS transporter [Paenibacillus silvae]MCK6270742.1 MFS transporter [Paenibacillus silvae]
MRECVLSVTVSNHPGVLARISNLFASLGINIDNIATVRSRDRHVSRVRIQAELDDEGVERISYSLQQLPDVIRLDKVRTRSKRFSYWSAAYGLFIAVMGLNLVSPIYAIYKQQWHLTPGMLSIAFAAYAIALIPTIIITGQLLSGGGFRRFLVPGLIIAMAGTLCLFFATSYPMLVIARVLQGISVGIFNGVTVAALTQLHPRQDRRQAAMVGAIAVTAGNALGPMMGGILAQYAPYPAQLPYVVHLLLMIPGLLCLISSRAELSGRTSGYRLHMPTLPRSGTKTFSVAVLSSFVAWGITSLYGSTIPMYLNEWIGQTSYVLSGLIVAIVLIIAALAQFRSARWKLRSMGLFGTLLIGAGLLLLVVTVHTGSMICLCASIVCVGMGYGPLYAASLALVNETTSDECRADVLSLFYVGTYLGVVLPAVGLGLMTQWFGLQRAFDCFAVLFVVLILTGLRGWSRQKTG